MCKTVIEDGVTLLFLSYMHRVGDLVTLVESLVKLMSDICSVKKLVANGIN